MAILVERAMTEQENQVEVYGGIGKKGALSGKKKRRRLGQRGRGS